MAKEYKKSMFVFRRDLRIHDNIGLLDCLKRSEKVIPCFIFTPEQLVNNRYKSDNAVQFMMGSLDELDKELRSKGSKLYLFYGKPHEVIGKMLRGDDEIDGVFVNRDYTLYSKKRDSIIERECKKYDVDFNSLEDVLLNPVGSITTGGGSVYTKFTPYFNRAKRVKVAKPTSNRYTNYVKRNYKGVGEFKGRKDRFYKHNDSLAISPGRSNGLKILRGISKHKSYNKTRDTLAINTTRLSPHNRFGTVSIREVYWAFKSKLGMRNELIKQLYWRDFYYNVGWAFPRVFGRYGNLKEKYDKIKWGNNRSWYNKWKEGKTGFPIVDACMNEINETGFMHNRGRLIVASFLIKILLVDWKLGELYFSNKLEDSDVCVNNGNWGWSSGSGADSQPYFRIFNPWTQGERFDPQCKYIKKWVPELEDVPNEHIHRWDEFWDEHDVDYPKPMVDYKKQREKAIKMYKRAFR